MAKGKWNYTNTSAKHMASLRIITMSINEYLACLLFIKCPYLMYSIKQRVLFIYNHHHPAVKLIVLDIIRKMTDMLWVFV